MPTNDFIVIGTGAGANVDSQATYAARNNAQGFQAGSVAQSSWVNKALRQSSFVSAGVAQFVVNALAINVADDGNLTTFVANLTAAVQAVVPLNGVQSFNGRTGAVALTSGDVTTALGGVPIFTTTSANGDITGVFSALTINNGAVTNAKFANAPALTLKGNSALTSGAVGDVPILQILTMLGLVGTLSGTSLTVTLPLVIGGVVTKVMFQLWQSVQGMTGEGAITISTPQNFPTQCLGAIGIGINNSNSVNKDLWLQTVQNSLAVNSVTFFKQGDSGGVYSLDGIIALAWGI